MRFGPRSTLIASLFFLGAGLLLFARTPVDGVYLTDVLAPTVLIGLGAGMGFPSLMMLSMSGATMEDSGLASGLINTTSQVGGAIGLAVLATLSTDRTDALLGDGESLISALNSGYHLAYLIGAALIVAALAVAVTVLRGGAPAIAGGHGAPAGDEAGEPGAEPAYAEAG
jgi:MFS family permease